MKAVLESSKVGTKHPDALADGVKMPRCILLLGCDANTLVGCSKLRQRFMLFSVKIECLISKY